MKNDNSYLTEKINLRLYNLPKKNSIKVLDCCAGAGVIWSNISNKTDRQLIITHIEKDNKKAKPYYLVGDNIKYLKTLDLGKYDIIDLDAYGIPYNQLEIIFNRKYKGIIFITFIQTLFGGIPLSMLVRVGYTEKMVKKCRTLFYRDGVGILFKFLYVNGIQKARGYIMGRKNYIMIDTRGA